MTDENVTQFRKAKKPKRSETPPGGYAWVCWCGGSSFQLLFDGTIECWECEQTQSLRYFDSQDGRSA